jgi:hypothetical protein
MSAATELELESELALEGEGEFELMGELEQELGLAHELTHEFELEHEQEAEHEAFFNHLAAMADRSGRSQALRRIAIAAARSALRSQARPWPVIEGESELGELESAHELEFESSPAEQAQAIAMMEHAGHAAAEAANEQEAAEHFLPLIGLAAKFVLPKLAGLAAKKLGGFAAKKIAGKVIGRVGGQLLRRVAPRLIRRVTPQLTRGLANVTRTLFRNRTTRPLIHAMPRIARTTVARLGRQIASGRRITPQQAVRTLAQQTARTLSNPRMLAQTYRRSLALDRRYHRRTRRVLGRPVGAPVRAADDSIVSPGTGFGAGIQATPFGAVAPVVSTPSAPGSVPGVAPAYGGSSVCRCASQPSFVPPPVCPTCGR